MQNHRLTKLDLLIVFVSVSAMLVACLLLLEIALSDVSVVYEHPP
jgi:hypothetical protein